MSQAALFPGTGPRKPNQLTDSQRATLVESCLNLCRKLARKAKPEVPGADLEDLEGEAFLACTEAAATFAPSLSAGWECDLSAAAAKFSTFAHPFIVKRLKGLAAAQRQRSLDASGLNWEIVPESEGEESAKPVEPTPDQLRLLDSLAEPSREAVRLVAFERISPDRAAVQLGLSVKDLKLILRNAAKAMASRVEWFGRPSLFAEAV